MSTQPASFSVTVETLPDAVVLAVSGDLDPHTAPELERRLADCLADPATEVVVDLSEVPFVDSSGLRVLLTALQALGDARRLVLRDPQPAVRRVVDLAGLGEVFDVR